MAYNCEMTIYFRNQKRFLGWIPLPREIGTVIGDEVTEFPTLFELKMPHKIQASLNEFPIRGDSFDAKLMRSNLLDSKALYDEHMTQVRVVDSETVFLGNCLEEPQSDGFGFSTDCKPFRKGNRFVQGDRINTDRETKSFFHWAPTVESRG
jgi:hypothetical protein